MTTAPVLLWLLSTACSTPRGYADECSPEEDPNPCPGDLVCVDRENELAAQLGPECSLPCTVDDDCPLGECHAFGDTRYIVCEADGFCSSSSGCQ